jgi:hypothetical protein
MSLARSGRRPGRLVVIASLLAVVVFFGLGGMGRGAVHAQDDPDCEDPNTVACIVVPPPPPPTQSPDQTQPSQGAAAPSAAAAAPAPPGFQTPPTFCPPPTEPPYPPYPYPGPLPAAPGAAAPSAAPPIPPAPYPCIADVYRSINRANLVYARAMRSLDSSQLAIYWGQDALRDLMTQIRGLRLSSSYRVLRLWSIDVVDQSIGYGSAWVHTREHWTTETWSYDGYQLDSGDAWYDNQYYLYRAGGRWLIGTDIVY